MIEVTPTAESAAILRRHNLVEGLAHTDLDPSRCICSDPYWSGRGYSQGVSNAVQMRSGFSADGGTCHACGGMTVRTGTCTTCTNCGETGGCG